MDKLGIELKLLAKFVSACQNPSLSDTAASLGLRPSALSTALHGLEERLGMRLFAQQGRYLGLLPSAFWLFRYAARLLYLESLARRGISTDGEITDRVVVRLNLSFAIGRFSKALLTALQDMASLHPATLVEWYFASPADDYELLSSGTRFPLASAGPTEVVDVFYEAPGTTYGRDDGVHLFDDPWIAVGAAGRQMDLSSTGDPLLALKMRLPLADAISRHMKAGHVGSRLRFLDVEPSELGRLLAETPHARFLMPQSLLADRLGLPRIEVAQLEPQLLSSVRGRAEGGSASKGHDFLACLAKRLTDPEEDMVFSPQISMRQIHYFNLVGISGGISAGARAANIAQSSLSSQIQSLERVVTKPLLQRRGDGAVLSPEGARLLPVSEAVEELHERMLRNSSDIAAHTQANVAIGTLPSSGHDSVLTQRVAQAITAVMATHPTWRLHVSEGSNTVLHEKVRAGELNLAIVGVVRPRFARISLGQSEPLSVVANPEIVLDGHTHITLEALCRLPLVLGTRHLSIHQSLAEAMEERNLQLSPKVEVGSLALAIAMVRRAPLCTVLPASSVRKDLEDGSLKALPIHHSELSGRLSIIFAADRTLSPAERLIVQELSRAFKEDRGLGQPREV